MTGCMCLFTGRIEGKYTCVRCKATALTCLLPFCRHPPVYVDIVASAFDTGASCHFVYVSIDVYVVYMYVMIVA